MVRVLVSNNSSLMRHIRSSPFRKMSLEMVLARTGSEIMEEVEKTSPHLAIIDAALPDMTGYEVARQIKAIDAGCRVVLVVGVHLGTEKMRLVVDSECDEVLVAPMGADQLYDSMALQLGLPRRGAERFQVNLAVVSNDGDRKIEGRLVDLSVEGARLILPALDEPIAQGTDLRLSITPAGDSADALEVSAYLVWSQAREGATIVGTAFEDIDDDTRLRLARLRHWDIQRTELGFHVSVKGDLTEVTDFEGLEEALVGQIEFDLSHVSYINPVGASEWMSFVKRLPVLRYTFHGCSIPFIQQAAVARDMLGRGSVQSFYAPYRCAVCNATEEHLLHREQVESDAGMPEPRCVQCQGPLELDDDGGRYLAFLHF